jgi:hypothetical protein
VEQAVSAYIGSMPFLWVEADDEPCTNSIRCIIESNSLALLSCCGEAGSVADQPSGEWLGRYCPKEAVRLSGLWNVRGVDGGYDPVFLDLLESCAERTKSP